MKNAVARACDASIRQLIGTGKHVLTVTSAPSELAVALRDAGNVVVEVSLDRIARAHEHGPELFHAVVFDEGLQDRDDRASLVNSSRALVRDGGFIVLVVTAPVDGSSRPLPRESLTRMIAECGLIPVKIIPVQHPSAGPSAFVVRASPRFGADARVHTAAAQPLIARLAEVEQHYRNLLVQAEARRAEGEVLQRELDAMRAGRDEALGAAAKMRADIDRLEHLVAAAASERLKWQEQEQEQAERLESALAHLAAAQADRDRLHAMLERLDTPTAQPVEATTDAELIRQRVGILEHLLSIERTSRAAVIEACDRIASLADNRRDPAAELTRLRIDSVRFDLELKLARATRRRDALSGSPTTREPISAAAIAARFVAAPRVRLLPQVAPERKASRFRRLRRLFRST